MPAKSKSKNARNLNIDETSRRSTSRDSMESSISEHSRSDSLVSNGAPDALSGRRTQKRGAGRNSGRRTQKSGAPYATMIDLCNNKASIPQSQTPIMSIPPNDLKVPEVIAKSTFKPLIYPKISENKTSSQNMCANFPHHRDAKVKARERIRECNEKEKSEYLSVHHPMSIRPSNQPDLRPTTQSNSNSPENNRVGFHNPRVNTIKIRSVKVGRVNVLKAAKLEVGDKIVMACLKEDAQLNVMPLEVFMEIFQYMDDEKIAEILEASEWTPIVREVNGDKMRIMQSFRIRMKIPGGSDKKIGFTIIDKPKGDVVITRKTANILTGKQ